MCPSKMLATASLLFAISRILRADTIFNFDSATLGTTTTFSEAESGLAATFSSPIANGFEIAPASGNGFNTLTGNVLESPGPTLAGAFAPLTISFSQNATGLSMDFATVGPDALILDAFENSTFVGQASDHGSIPPGNFYPEGTLSFDGSLFNSVTLSTDSPYFAIDNLDVRTTGVPEPSSAALLGIGLAPLIVFALCRRWQPGSC